MARKSRKTPQAEFEAPKAVKYAACGYARISIDGERSEDSIENQTAIIKDYAGDKPDLDLRGVIPDLGFTGRDFDRPGYLELMDGIKRGDVECVIVKDLSRVGRTYIEVGELLFDTFPAYNVRFISVNDQYDSFADDAARKKLLILFKNLINHMYSRDLGKKIRSAHTAKKQRGELAGLPPYGYRRGDDGITLVTDSDAAEIVKTVFDMRLGGMSANGIAKHLTRECVPSPQNRRYQLGQITHEKFATRIVWNVGMISNILQCETYTGTLVQGKYDCDGKRHTLLPKEQWIRHENTHQAIISREQFDAVQELMRETAAKYDRSESAPLPENRYAGKIFCSRCGKAAARVTGGSTRGTVFYYRCRACGEDLKIELGLKTMPNLPLVRLDYIVMDYLQKQMDLLVGFDRIIEQLAKSESQSQKRQKLLHERAKWEKTVNGADKTLSAAYAHHLDGLLDLREFEIVRAKVERDKRDAAAGLAVVESELRTNNDMAKRHSYWRKVYADFRTAETPTKELVQALVSRIEFMPVTNEVHVILNYKDGLEEYRELIGESGVSENA
jgi:DNA invertase Pin-like site-specific DNA recombinase/transposase-like protein